MEEYDNTEEVITLMKELSVGSEVLYADGFGSYNPLIRKGIITAIQKHDNEGDPICSRCIGKIGINGEPPKCILSNIINDGKKYSFIIKSIIYDDFLKKEEFEI